MFQDNGPSYTILHGHTTIDIVDINPSFIVITFVVPRINKKKGPELPDTAEAVE